MSLDHEARRNTLGASEIHAACGKSPYQSRLDLWKLKTGRAKPFGGNRYTEWGNILEPVVAEAYFKRHMPEVTYVGSTAGTQMNDKPWAATPDRLVFTDSSPKPSWLLEIKTASNDDEWGPSGSQEIPEGYLYQIQWQMYVCGMDRCDVAVLIGGNDYREYSFRRDPELIDKLIAGAEDFWSYVERDEPPPEDVKDDTPVIESTPELESAIGWKLQYSRERKTAEENEQSARKEVIRLIPKGSKCIASKGTASWSERKGTTKTDFEAAFWATNKDNPIAQSVLDSFTNTSEPTWVLTVKGKK